MDSNHRSRRERDGRGGGGPRPTIVVSRDDLCLMTPVQLIGPAGQSRETLFAKSGTDGSNPVPSSGESSEPVKLTIRFMVDPNVAFTAVRASRGKVVRAEPVAAPPSTTAPSRVRHSGGRSRARFSLKRRASRASRGRVLRAAASATSHSRVWFRRILSVPVRSGGGRLTERILAVPPRLRERVKVPLSCRSRYRSGSPTVGRDHSFCNPP